MYTCSKDVKGISTKGMNRHTKQNKSTKYIKYTKHIKDLKDGTHGHIKDLVWNP